MALPGGARRFGNRLRAYVRGPPDPPRGFLDFISGFLVIVDLMIGRRGLEGRSRRGWRGGRPGRAHNTSKAVSRIPTGRRTPSQGRRVGPGLAVPVGLAGGRRGTIRLWASSVDGGRARV